MLLKKGYETLRITFNGLKQKDNRLKEIMERLSKIKNIRELEYTWNNELMSDTEHDYTMDYADIYLDYVHKFILIYRMVENLVDNYIFKVEEINLVDRQLFNYNYVDYSNKQEFRVIQIGFFKLNQSVFGIGFIKLDAMYFNLLDQSYDLQFLRNTIKKMSSTYLNRVDFYFDFDFEDINEFLKTNKIVGFREGSLLKGKMAEDTSLNFKKGSTLYRGEKKSKRVCVRLYDKREDSLIKKKQKYYDYITPITKRLEIEVEVKKIQEYKQTFTGNIEEFINHLYKEIVYKELNQNNDKIKTCRMFQIYFLDENIKSNHTINKSEIKDQDLNLVMERFINSGKRLKGELTKELFNVLMEKIYK